MQLRTFNPFIVEYNIKKMTGLCVFVLISLNTSQYINLPPKQLQTKHDQIESCTN